MAEGRNVMQGCQGFYDYRGINIDAYRPDVLKRTLAMLRQTGHFRPAVIDASDA
jgi:hypothetical protein